MKTLLTLALLIGASQVSAYEYCSKYQGNSHESKLRHLADRLSYNWGDFCNHDRILDVQHQEESYFYSDRNHYENHDVYTLHYNEYSCEYHYNSERKKWIERQSNCYNTW